MSWPIFWKTDIFISVIAFLPHVNGVFGQQKSRFLKTVSSRIFFLTPASHLSKMEVFGYDDISYSVLALRMLCKGDVTRDDSQRRFLAQHSVAMLEQCCNLSKQCRNNVGTLCCAKNRRSESSGVTSP